MPKYCLVGYLHNNLSRGMHNIVGGRVVDLKTLKFSNIEIRKLQSLIESKECVGVQINKEVNKENFYLYTNGKERYIKEYGSSIVILGKARNCYLGTDGNEYIKLLDMETVCETDSLCKNYIISTCNTKIYTSRNFEVENNRELRYLNNEDLVLFPEYKSNKVYKTTDINTKLIMLDAGYYITSNLDVIVTNASKLKLISDKGLIKTIGKYGGFRMCENLNTVRLGDNVKFIYDFGFYKCTNLKKLGLGKSVRYIGEQAFGFCESLEEVNLRNGIVQIASMAFSNCVNLRKVTIPKTVKQLQPNIFANCRSLEEIKVSTEKHKNIFEEYKQNGYINNHVNIILEVKKSE